MEGVNETEVLAHRDIKDMKVVKHICTHIHSFFKNQLFKIFINLSKTQ